MLLKNNVKYIIACGVMLVLAFIQCYRTVHDLHWAYEPDFDRDIGYIRNVLNGRFGMDPNLAGEYMWYNPLLYMTESLAVKITGLPVNIVVARAGAFINLVSPVAFFVVLVKLFDYKIALAALLSFLFLASGNLPCWGAATYSPWLLADNFVQFIFYINLYLCYKAFTTQRMLWFAILGAFIGIGFLGHAAPTIIIILILIFLQAQNIYKAVREKRYPAIGTYVVQGIFTGIPFIIFSFPFLYFIWGKYHMHFVNRIILECAPGIFARKESLTLIKLNITPAGVISVIGLVWFYKNYHTAVIRKIILYWFYITLFMYLYEAILPTANRTLHISLPDTIPAMHYFFYLKGVMSVFFGFGLIFLANYAIRLTDDFRKGKHKTGFSAKLSDNLVVLFILAYALAYYPIYSNRLDFSGARQQALDKEKEKDNIDVYNYITKNIPLDDVVLCEHGQSLFPVMATGVKMVSVEVYFSNPYISYQKREDDRNDMISYLIRSTPASAVKLFTVYKVNFVLLTNKLFAQYKSPAFAASRVVYKNGSYTLLELGNYKSI